MKDIWLEGRVGVLYLSVVVIGIIAAYLFFSRPAACPSNWVEHGVCKSTDTLYRYYK